MGWENWPSWLKGGVIGGAIGLIVSLFKNLLSLFYPYYPPKLPFLEYILLPFTIFSMIVFLIISPFICKGDMHECGSSIILFIVVEVFFYFLVGALIGWIYGKIKSKGKKK